MEKAGGRVLVVEDESGIQYALGELLRRDGFDVHVTGRGREVPGALSAFDPDPIILDLGLPDVNGFDLLKDIRTQRELPIIVLSGREAESDRVLALELGADDYVVKPFLNRELVARIRARLRRPAGVEKGTLGDAGLRIDRRSRDVVLDGSPVEVTAKEFALLEHMAASPRQVFSRAQLLDAVWGSNTGWQQESTVTEHVHRLRKKLGAQRIVTVRGVGYRFDPAPATPTGCTP